MEQRGQGPSSFQVFGNSEVEQRSVVLSPCICGDLLHNSRPLTQVRPCGYSKAQPHDWHVVGARVLVIE